MTITEHHVDIAEQNPTIANVALLCGDIAAQSGWDNSDYTQECKEILRERPDLPLSFGELNAILTKVFGDKSSPGEKLALIHSEASEALEEFRSGRAFRSTYYSEVGKPEGPLSELADIIIRIFHWASKEGAAYPLQEMIFTKLRYNLKRGYRHGGKQF